MIPSTLPSVIPKYPSTSNSPATMIENGRSRFNVSLCTASGVKSAHTPQTTIRLKMLEPTALLTARALLPAMEAVTLTAVSGRLVPIATTVIPMMIDGTRRRFATLALPSTKKSAPLIKKIKPTISVIIATINSLIPFLLFSYWFLWIFPQTGKILFTMQGYPDAPVKS